MNTDMPELGQERIVDHGAPQISAAEAEFQNAAKYWQQRAAEASANAAKYADLARMMGLAYQDAISRSHIEYDGD